MTDTNEPKVLNSQMFRPEKPADWELYRTVITDLYGNHTLTEVTELMKELHFFYATPKQYKTKFREWGLTTKYVKDFEYEELLNQEEQDEYEVRGKRVSHQDVARFRRRKEKSESSKGSKSSRSGKSSSSAAGGAGAAAGQAYGYEYYDDNGGEGSSGTYMASTSTSGGQYVLSADGGSYMTADGTAVSATAAGYSGYAYDTSGGSGSGQIYMDQGSYDQQGTYDQQGNYHQQQGYGEYDPQ
ncbi:hypothetical protein SEUCBS140593_003593 [Sporothrix eucalyptigena]|uniref:Clr5 domain-containing protein n=1 Tax=Sporothrix eucalyptigena TaxID=1812306 RepID=A0ABP0BGD7_9PEZI